MIQISVKLQFNHQTYTSMNIHSTEARRATAAYGKKVLSSRFRRQTHRWAVGLISSLQRAERASSLSSVRYKGSVNLRQVH